MPSWHRVVRSALSLDTHHKTELSIRLQHTVSNLPASVKSSSQHHGAFQIRVISVCSGRHHFDTNQSIRQVFSCLVLCIAAWHSSNKRRIRQLGLLASSFSSHKKLRLDLWASCLRCAQHVMREHPQGCHAHIHPQSLYTSHAMALLSRCICIASYYCSNPLV